MLGERGKLPHGFALGGGLEAGLNAGLGFAIEGLGHGGGAAHLAQDQDFNLELAAFIADGEHVSEADFTGELGLDTVGVDAAEVAGFGCLGAGFEEAGGPEPFVDAYGGHDRLSYAGGSEGNGRRGERDQDSDSTFQT